MTTITQNLPVPLVGGLPIDLGLPSPSKRSSARAKSSRKAQETALDERENIFTLPAKRQRKKAAPELRASKETKASIKAPKVAKRPKAIKEVKAKKPKRRIRDEGTSAEDRVSDRYLRAQKQKMFLLDRTCRGGQYAGSSQSAGSVEEFHVLGSAGAVYKIVIGPQNTCSCMDWMIRGRSMQMNCKHIMFILVKVLRVPDSSTIWSRQFMSQEDLHFIQQNAPSDPIGGVVADDSVVASWRTSIGAAVPGPADPAADEAASLLLRLPEEGDSCPICFDDFPKSRKSLLFCIGGCNRPTHAKCQQEWLKSCGYHPTCVYCRAKWNADEMQAVNTRVIAYLDAPKSKQSAVKAVEAAPAPVIIPGVKIGSYINVAAAAGMSLKRDTSTYRRKGKLTRVQQAAQDAERAQQASAELAVAGPSGTSTGDV